MMLTLALRLGLLVLVLVLLLLLVLLPALLCSALLTALRCVWFVDWRGSGSAGGVDWAARGAARRRRVQDG